MARNSIILFYPKTEKENINKNVPLSLLKVASELKGSGYKTVIIDERFDKDYKHDLKNLLEDAVFFGASVMTGYQIQGALNASFFVKSVNTKVPVVWGGWHPSILPEETLKNDNIDIVIRGQGEGAALILAEALKKGNSLKGIEGLAYKERQDIVVNPPRLLQDLNTFKPVDFETLDIKRYISKSDLGDRSIFWNTSQGCPYACGFCSTPAVFKRRWSGLNGDSMIRDVKNLVALYGIDAITFAEDNFFVDIKRIEKFCRGLLDAGIRIKWATDVRVDQVNRLSEDFMGLLKKSGCKKLYIGAESGDDNVLKLVDKRIEAKDIYVISEKLYKSDIISEFFIIMGFPINPEEDLKNSLTLIKNVKLHYPNHQFTPFLYTPYPGTPLLKTSIEKGLKIPDKLEGWIDWSIISVNTPWVSRQYLDKVNMYTKCFYPLAFPSKALKSKFRKPLIGIFYKALHKISKFRVEKNLFMFPIEWHSIKIFHKFKTKFNIFKNVESFR